MSRHVHMREERIGLEHHVDRPRDRAARRPCRRRRSGCGPHPASRSPRAGAAAWSCRSPTGPAARRTRRARSSSETPSTAGRRVGPKRLVRPLDRGDAPPRLSSPVLILVQARVRSALELRRHRLVEEQALRAPRPADRCRDRRGSPASTSARRLGVGVGVGDRVADRARRSRVEHVVDEGERVARDAARPWGSPSCRSRSSRLPWGWYRRCRRRSSPPRRGSCACTHVARIAEGDADIAVGEIVDVFARNGTCGYRAGSPVTHRGRRSRSACVAAQRIACRDKRAPPGTAPARCRARRCRKPRASWRWPDRTAARALSTGAASPSAAFTLARVVADAGGAPHIGHAELVAGIGIGRRRQDLRIEIAVILELRLVDRQIDAGRRLAREIGRADGTTTS